MWLRRACPAALAVLLLVGSQLAALVHNATTRHVTCAEHGETLEAPVLAEPLHACDQDHVVGVEGDSGEDHDDCSIARLLQQSAATPHHVVAPMRVPAGVECAAALASTAVAITADLYRIAPKTSPPAAA